MPVLHSLAALGQKNSKYPLTCSPTPTQVGHRVTTIYPLLVCIILLFRLNGHYKINAVNVINSRYVAVTLWPT